MCLTVATISFGLEENRCPYSGSIMQTETLDIEYYGFGLCHLVFIFIHLNNLGLHDLNSFPLGILFFVTWRSFLGLNPHQTVFGASDFLSEN